MRIPIGTLLVAVAVVFITPFGGADHSHPCSEDWSYTYTPTDGATHTYPVYVLTFNVPMTTDGPWGFWIYAESNLVEGLQRHDTCHDVDANGEPYTRATADTLVF